MAVNSEQYIIVCSTKNVLFDNKLITIVQKMLGTWLIFSYDDFKNQKKILEIVGFDEIVQLDETLLELINMPEKHLAQRKFKGDRWIIEQQDKPILNQEELQIMVDKMQVKQAGLIDYLNNNFLHKLELEGIYNHDKSLPIYKYVSYERAVQIMSNRSIRYSPCKDFNDPYELTDALLKIDYEEAIQKVKKDALGQASDIDSEELKLISELLDNKKEKYYKQLNSVFDKYRDKIGIFCASKSFLNTLMWSYYADNHKGVCLGFYIKPVEVEQKSYMSVAYKQHLMPVRFSYLDESQMIFAFLYWMNVKSKVWEHEQEIRVINYQGNGVQPLENMEIKEIYYGVGLSEEYQQNLEKFLTIRVHNIIKKGKMKTEQSSFNLGVTLIDDRTL